MTFMELTQQGAAGFFIAIVYLFQWTLRAYPESGAMRASLQFHNLGGKLQSVGVGQNLI